MRRPTFLHGVFAAALFALTGSIAATALIPMTVTSGVYQLLVTALGLAYVLYLLSLSKERVGRITTLSVWAGMSFSLWLFAAPFGLFLIVQIAALWLVRSLYFYSSALSAFLDLALNLAALAVAYWAAVHTGSVFLCIWCFFLVQALFVAIPPAVLHPADRLHASGSDPEKFERARLRAENAFRQLFAQ
tara:strand:- start:200434 stop:201000 length:567 start_codon:yes stop_codon:yes gene_type:complete